jgi:hypothetical protein
MAPSILPADGNNSETELSALAAALDSTPVITWLAQQRQLGTLDRTGLRRGVMMRMIWQMAYYTSTSLVANIDYLLGRSVWGNDVRATLAADICAMRGALATAGHRLAYSSGPRKGYYVRGRPELDPQLVRGIRLAIASVDPARCARLRGLTPAQRFQMGVALTEAHFQIQAARLRLLSPRFSQDQALRIARQSDESQ